MTSKCVCWWYIDLWILFAWLNSPVAEPYVHVHWLPSNRYQLQLNESKTVFGLYVKSDLSMRMHVQRTVSSCQLTTSRHYFVIYIGHEHWSVLHLSGHAFLSVSTRYSAVIHGSWPASGGRGIMSPSSFCVNDCAGCSTCSLLELRVIKHFSNTEPIWNLLPSYVFSSPSLINLKTEKFLKSFSPEDNWNTILTKYWSFCLLSHLDLKPISHFT